MNLFCFSYAGGSASFYYKWQKLMNANITIIPVEMPGRGTRFDNKLCDNMEDLIDDLYSQIKDNLQETYMLYGHSMGSWVVYYLCERIKKEGAPMPDQIFISGKEAPHVKKFDKKYHELSTKEFIRSVYSLGGTPRELLENVELMRLYLPILKNDYKVLENCEYRGGDNVFYFDITMFTGSQDILTEEDVHSWSLFTSKNFNVYEFEGGHFFIHDYTQDIVDIIATHALVNN